ncbi:enoyl-CoA hydratase/isomerase [Roseibium aggregatum]|uniref:Enoyl-CoA hydratase/isomerase n=1 Tax=Roseibium aggregatum TaxID=187304 RepID=A0A939EA12_9HYPH|nr:enoyl-CoA hydratase/isomerase [Roseibium aggregatum]MBN9669601.1 enoyl-CoA hydratase/isomerase [Roseibium aggregatum]
MSYETLKVSFKDSLCRIAFDRPDVGNAINAPMIRELGHVLEVCAGAEGQDGKPVTVVVIEGGEEVFCAGGDFEAVTENGSAGDPAPLYDLWLKLAQGPFVTVALVKGRVNAGGVGFVAASDIVIAGKTASFSLSELLFGLFPACVLPFLIARIGKQRAHYMTLMTKPVTAADALASGLVDVTADDAEAALRQHLARLRHLGRPAIARYKAYLAGCSGDPVQDRSAALEANRAVFSDPVVLAGIRRYVTDLKFPWEE